jgi:hypothetical protein
MAIGLVITAAKKTAVTAKPAMVVAKPVDKM